MELKQTMEIIEFVCTVATSLAAVVAGIVIPVILHRAQKQKATLDYIKAGRDSWIQIDLGLIGNPALLRLADSILAPGSEASSDEERQKTWIALMILNVAFTDFIGQKYGYHEQEEKETLNNFIKTLMRDELTFKLSQQAYNEAFRATCREARGKIAETLKSVAPPPKIQPIECLP